MEELKALLSNKGSWPRGASKQASLSISRCSRAGIFNPEWKPPLFQVINRQLESSLNKANKLIAW
jgi:hypothetical protein